MSSDRITSKDVILMLGSSIAGAVIPGVIGWYTGSFDVVLSFASAKPLESALWTFLFLSLGALAGQLVRGRSANKELDEKDAEIARLMDDNLALKKQLDVQKAPGAVAALQTMAVAVSKPTEPVRTPSGKLCCNMTSVRQLPTETVEAMLDAFDHGGGAKLGAHEKWVRKSINDEDGIFRIGRKYFMGYPGDETDDYFLMKDWLKFMDDAGILAQMRSIVRSAGPIWHEL